MNDKNKCIVIYSSILLALIVINIIFWIFAIGSNAVWAIILAYPLVLLDIIILSFWIASLTIKYKEFDYEGNKISVYAGFINHYLKINGALKDEIKTMSTFVPITLLYKDDKLNVDVTISTGFIKIKINDKLVK